jgi:drug/metabolite transporter (DMT)-like permease
MSPALRGSFYGILAAAIWGGMYVVSDVVLEIIPPFTLLSVRLLMGIAVLWVISHRSAAPRPQGREWWKLWGVGMVGFGVSVGAQFIGTDLSSAVNGSLITSASPAFILIFAALILGERLNARLIGAVVLASIGVIVIIDPTQAEFGSQTFAGDIALAVAAITWGLYSVLVRWVSQGWDTLVVTTIAFIGGLSLTLPAAILELTQESVGKITLPVLLGLLYLGVISTAVAMWAWNRAFALVEASRASLFFFAQPFVGAGLSVLLLGQAFTLPLAVGSLLIIGGVLLSLYQPKIV